MYTITDYTKKKAKLLGVVVKPSPNKKKKIDVYSKDGKKKISSIGGVKNDGSYYNDYPTYLKNDGKKKANERRRLYKIRHEKTRKIIGTPSYYADKLLW